MPEPQYSTFLERLAASLLDVVAFIPLMVAFFLASRMSWAAYVAIQIIGNIVSYGFTIYCHATYGKTPGKWIIGLRIVDDRTGAAITLRQSVLRSAVDVGFGLLSLEGRLLAAASLDVNHYSALASDARLDLLTNAYPGWATWFDNGALVWLAIEILYTLANRKRRSPSDYIAGTVVIVEPKTT